MAYRVGSLYGEYDRRLRDWLYGDWNEKKLHQYEVLSNVPLLNNWMNYHLDRRSDEEYMNRYGMSYNDIHDPRKLSQTASGSAMIGSAVSMMSSNIHRLYRDLEKDDERDSRYRKKSQRSLDSYF